MRQLSLFPDWRHPESDGPATPTPPATPTAATAADMCGALAYYRAVGGGRPDEEPHVRGLVLGSD